MFSLDPKTLKYFLNIFSACNLHRLRCHYHLKKTRKLLPLFLRLCASAVSRLLPYCRLLRLIGFSSTATPPVRLIVLPLLVKRFQNLSGDHDMTFPYVGVEQWIVALNLAIDSPWKPFYVNNQVGGYEMTYVQREFSTTFATIKVREPNRARLEKLGLGSFNKRALKVSSSSAQARLSRVRVELLTSRSRVVHE
ncbi:hypothetical protein LXL04_010875 [Taraxacum kok-saghyz]